MLLKKMIRNIKSNLGVYISCITITILAIIIFTLFSSVMESLNSAKTEFYTETNFADGFMKVINMPQSEISKLKRLDEIEDVEGRIEIDGRTEDDKFIRFVTTTERINTVQILEGYDLTGTSNTILMEKKFFDANKMKLNDEIEIILVGKKIKFKVVGVVNSSEFIYALRDITELYPNPEKFGIAFISKKTLDSILGEKDVINSAVFMVKDNTEFKVLRHKIEDKFEKYGVEYIVPKKDQQSNLILSQELAQLESMAKSLPLMFLMISAFILLIVLKRLVENERGQIGILKSFGYSNFEVVFHYVSYGLFVGLVGGVVGGTLGYMLANPMIDVYKQYFSIPGIERAFNVKFFILGILIAISISMVAAMMASRKILKLTPANAMRPKELKFSKNYFFEKIRMFWGNLTSIGKMAIRNVFRNRGRSVFTMIGIAISFAMLGAPFAMNNLMDKMVFDQFEKVQLHDFKITFRMPVLESDIRDEFERYKVKESLLEVPFKLKNLNKEKNAIVIGVDKDASLYNVLDDKYNKVDISSRGIVLTERLAKGLNAKKGDKLKFESFYMDENIEEKEVLVTDIIPQYLGLNAYMEKGFLQDLLENDKIVTSVVLKTDKEDVEYLREKYKDSNIVSNMDSQSEMIGMIEEMMEQAYASIVVMILFGILLAFSVIYSSSLVTLSERKRELSSLRLVGMSIKEVTEIIIFEQWFIAIFAFLIGVPMLKSMLTSLANSIETDLYSMPSDVGLGAIIMAFIFTGLAILIAQYVVQRKIKGFDLVEVLKERE